MSEDGGPPSGGRLTLARSRGVVSGVLLVLLGLWGALVPFVGPYFHFAYSPDKTWHWTAARGWFEVLPGAVAVAGGLLLIMSANRLLTSLGAWLAVAGGGWFVVAPTLAPVMTLGSIHGPVSPGVVKSTVEALTFFTGLGAFIVLVGALAIGRLSVRSARDISAATAVVPVVDAGPGPEPVERPEAPPPVATNESPDAAYAPGGATPVTNEIPADPVAGGPAYPPAPPSAEAVTPPEPARPAAEPVQPEPVQHPPGYGQRVPTYYHGGPSQPS